MSLQTALNARFSHTPRAALSAAWLAAVLAGPADSHAQEVSHPVIKRVAGAREIPTSPAPVPIRLLADNLIKYRKIWEIGKLEGGRHEVFGNPISAAVAPSGEIAVLDAMYNDVRLFNAKGEFIAMVGGAGRGPLEFRSPVSIRYSPRGDMLVITRLGMKIIRFENNTFSNSKTLDAATFTSPSDGCFLRGEVINRASSGRRGVVEVINQEGKILRSFGEGYAYGSQLAREDLSVGQVSCDEERQAIIVGFANLPFIRAYGVAGDLLWTSFLKDFRPLRFIERGPQASATIRRDFSEGGDLLLSMVSVPGGAVLIQIGRLKPVPGRPGRATVTRRDSYLISTADGSGVFLTDRLPHVLSVDKERIYAADQEPEGFIKVVAYEYQH